MFHKFWSAELHFGRPLDEQEQTLMEQTFQQSMGNDDEENVWESPTNKGRAGVFFPRGTVRSCPDCPDAVVRDEVCTDCDQIWRECRDFNYAAYSDGGGRISEGQACRQADGSWKIWKAKEINQHDSPGWETGEPQLVPTSPLEPEEDGDSPGWDTGEPQLVPTSPLEPEEDGEG